MRKKVVNLEYLKDFDWIVGTALYLDELNRPILLIVILNMGIALFVAALLFFLIHRINSSIETQVNHIGAVMRQSLDGNLWIHAEESGPSEIREIARNLNMFIDNLESLLREKENLIQEIQHRVKNNLQTISSLLNLQESAASSDEIARLLRKNQNRIKSMAIVYDQILLDHSRFEEDSLPIDLFLDNYISTISISYQNDKKSVFIEKDIERIQIARNRAICIGLITNELISHSFEHAFPDGFGGTINISLTADSNNGIRFSIRDNGNPTPYADHLPTGPDDSGRFLSLTLVDVLVQQLKGEYEFGHPNGNEITITFPK